MSTPRNALRRTLMAATVVLTAATSLLVNPAPAAAHHTTMSARSLLLTLPVRAENGAGFSPTQFSNNTWHDHNHDCQNTANEVLIAESKVAVTFTTASHCVVKSGRWFSWYDGRTWTIPSDVEVDHVVALKEAWESGARAWTAYDRMRYFNDTMFAWTLDAVTDDVDVAKAAKDPAQWLPPLTTARCTYAIHWIAIKYRWRMSIDTAEKTKLSSILSGTCGARTVTVPDRAR